MTFALLERKLEHVLNEKRAKLQVIYYYLRIIET